MEPWHLLRYGVRRAIICLHWRFRRVNCKSASPIPRIVLIRVDGEAVPVSFAEDHQASLDIRAVRSPLESENVEMDNSRSAAAEGEEECLDMVPSSVYGGVSCIATESEALSMRAGSHEGEHQGGVAKAQDGIGLEFAVDVHVVNEAPVWQAENSSVFIETENEPPVSVEKDTLPAPNTLMDTADDSCGADGGTDNFEHMAFLKAAANDVSQDVADVLDEREDQDQDLAFIQRSLVNDHDPDELETSSEIDITARPLEGSEDLAKNVRFDVCDDPGRTDCWQAPLNVSHTDIYYPTRARIVESHQPGNDRTGLVEIPMVPFEPPMDRTSPEQVTRPVPLVVREGVAEIEAPAQFPLPSANQEPVVNLPLFVGAREDGPFVEMDPMIPAALIENVATVSPLQIPCPTMPVVVINMKCTVREEKQNSTPLRTEGLDQYPFRQTETLDHNAAACEILDIVAPRQHGSCRTSPPINGLYPTCSPIFDIGPPLGDSRTIIELSASLAAEVCEIGMPAADNSLGVIGLVPCGAKEVPETDEREVEILYETPRYLFGGNDLARSLQNVFQGPEDSGPDSTNAGMHLPTVSEPPMELGIGDRANLVTAEKSDTTTITLSEQPTGFASAATELPTAKLSEGILVLSCQATSPLSVASAEQRTVRLDYGRSREFNTIPWDHPSTTPKPPPERTLSGSMHAPPASLPVEEPDDHIDRTSVVYQTSLFLTCSVPLERTDHGEAGMKPSTDNRSERGQDLSASIHAPQGTSEAEVVPSISQSAEDNNRDHCRSATNPVAAREEEPVTKPCPPNWAAMPDVVDAFRMFKEAPRGNTIRRASSIAECMNRTPMEGLVGQKGIATHSLNNTSAIANIQSRWMHGNRLLLVRDLVPSDPADFNLRSWYAHSSFVGTLINMFSART